LHIIIFQEQISKDSVLEQKKEDSKLIRVGKIQDLAQKYNPPSQELGTTRAISHMIVPHPRIALLLLLLYGQATY